MLVIPRKIITVNQVINSWFESVNNDLVIITSLDVWGRLQMESELFYKVIFLNPNYNPYPPPSFPAGV